ncbi:hypothetical protein GF325_00640, partial [Candidatus Bathyarchaeota archaeon]|nr:hypothetical protein [Candidatus Bathyarchaeota archaeon]
MQNRIDMRARGKVLIFVVLACFVVAMGFAMNDDEKNTVDNAAILESNPDSPVYIENNQDLAEFASSGFGTPDDPFIIENLVIDCAAYSDNGIYIRDTTAHFIVRNCFVSNTQTGRYGIFLLRVKHGTINGNAIHSTYSLYFRECENISINNNYIQDNRDTGIFLYNTTYATIQNNTLDSNEKGIFLNLSPNNTIRSNKISGAHEVGIYISSSSRFTRVENNTVQGTRATSGLYGGIGMYVMSENNTFIDNFVLDNDGDSYDYSGIGLLVFGDGNHFKNNTVANSTGSGEGSGVGFLFSSASHNTLALNTVRDNTGGGLLSGMGMLFLSSSNNKVNWSIIQGNQNSGIALSASASNNDIWLNGFYDNNGSGIQACDNGTSNSWHISNRGNYWSDFLLVNPGATPLNNIYWGANYSIDGSSGSFDLYSLITYHHGYLPSYPITIHDTADFQAYASSGSGTREDPFILENLCINTTTMGNNGITIVGTNDFFTIRHCIFEDTDSYFGIYFSDVSNGFIEDCTCFKNYGGVYLFKCMDISVTRSIVNDTVYGFYLYQTNNTLLLRNEVDTSDIGIYLRDAHFNKAIENFIHDCVECGFDHSYSSWNEISGNLIMDITGTSTSFTGVGIQIIFSEHVKLLNTTVMRCQAGSNSYSGNGGYMIHCSDITIQDCAFNLNDGGLEYKSGNGLYMENITSSIIKNTQLCDNAAGFTDSGNGLYLLSSSSNTISNCIAAGNYGTDSETGNGFYLFIADNTTLLDCIARHNQNHVSGDYAGNGFLVLGSDNVEINNCTSRDNIGTSNSFTGIGVLIANSDGAIMVNSHLHDNLGSSILSGAGMLSISSDQGEFIGNHVHGNDDLGIYVNGMENLFYLNNLTNNSYTWQAQDYGNN